MKRINIKELIKNKKYVLIISIIAFILLVVGATYAYFTWTSNKINTVVSSKCFEIFYEKGNDIEGEIMPSYDYTGGLYSVIKMDINSSCNIDAIGKLYLDVSEETSTNLYREGLLNYQVLKNGELTDIKGNITGAGEIEIYLGKLNRNLVATTEYTIYVWIDYNLVNNNDVYSKFSGSIRGEAVQGFAQETEETLVTHITNLYLNNKDDELVKNNDILYRYASIYDKDEDDTTSGGLMNDRHGSMDTEEDAGNIRYYGFNPNNYIYFNCSDYSNQSESTCEVWRIIGVFDGKVKIMKNSLIGQLAWDQNKNQDPSLTTYNNDWSTSSLQEFLNGKYYDRGEDTTYTYYNGSDGSSSVDINLESIGIKNDETRGLISESLWYLKGWNNTSIYSDQMYDYERNNGEVYNTSWLTTMPGNIAIPYASDYGYAVDLGSCSGKTLDQYSDTTCTSANWMKPILGTSSYGWLMAPRSSASSAAWFVSSLGYVSNRSVYNAYGVAPVLHLNSELGIEAGDGSENSPYKLEVKTENKEQNFVQYLTNKYMSANPSKATVANNGINYYYAPSVNMMNDGMNASHVWEDGANTGNIRYYGKTPANYIDIGDRDSSGNVIPWRIIGVFNNMRLADGTTDTLVKVIRDDSIGFYKWNDDRIYDWNSATLKTYLNEGEYYTNLSQGVKDKIAMVEWNLGGYFYTEIYSNDIYAYERGTLKCYDCTYETIWEGNIALMYPSDYGYAADLTKCSEVLLWYDTTNCKGTDWLLNDEWQWLLTPYTDASDRAWNVNNDATSSIVHESVGVINGVHPVLYLKSSLVRESGDGSSIESAYVVR